MMRLGIYGYEFSRAVEFNDHRLIPITGSPLDACDLASDLNKYNLTGFLELKDELISDVNAYVFDLSGVLSFIDQKTIVIKNQLKDSETYKSLEKNYPTSLKCDYRNDGGGEVIIKDSISADSRGEGAGSVLGSGVSSHAVIGSVSSGLKSRPGNCSFTPVALRSSV